MFAVGLRVLLKSARTKLPRAIATSLALDEPPIGGRRHENHWYWRVVRGTGGGHARIRGGRDDGLSIFTGDSKRDRIHGIQLERTNEAAQAKSASTGGRSLTSGGAPIHAVFYQTPALTRNNFHPVLRIQCFCKAKSTKNYSAEAPILGLWHKDEHGNLIFLSFGGI